MNTLHIRGCLAALLPIAALLACASGPNGAATQMLAGQVVNTSQAPLANVELSVGDQRTASDANGRFALSLPAEAGTTVVVSALHPAHGRLSRTLSLPTDAELTVLMLRPYDLVAPVTLPGPGGAPVSVGTPDSPNGSVSLTIAPGNLVTASGAAAVGPAEVRLAYWGATDDHASSPSILWGIEADQSVSKLDTYGMADFAVYQGSERLTLGQGQNLLLTMALNEDHNALYSDPVTQLPNVYSVDPNLGLWTYAGTLEDPSRAQQKSASPIGPLAHRQSKTGDNVRVVKEQGRVRIYIESDRAWNIDVGLNLNFGGCATGRTVDACTKQPVGNVEFTQWLLSIEEVAAFQGKSDDSATFCIATPFSTWSSTPDQRTAVIKYVISKRDDASKTAYCNPAAKWPECFIAPDKLGGKMNSRFVGQLNYVSDCRLGSSNKNADQGSPLVRYWDICTPPSAVMSVSPCTFCSKGLAPTSCLVNKTNYQVKQAAGNASCTQLGDVPVPTPTCLCDATGNCRPLCKNSHVVGSPCTINPKDPQNADPFIACCNKEGQFKLGQLKCSDDVCIPAAAL